MDTDRYVQFIVFDSDDSEFARGFEAGRLWALLRERPSEPVEEYAHAANAEMLLRLAEATGRTVQSTELDDGWLAVQFGLPVQEEME